MSRSRCVFHSCENFGNPKKQGYCNHHGDSLGIRADSPLPQVCGHAHCHTDMVISGWGGYVDGLQLPCGFSRLVKNRAPIPGDKVLSTCELSGDHLWLRNSIGIVALVDADRGKALIHFDCQSLFQLTYDKFVVIE